MCFLSPFKIYVCQNVYHDRQVCIVLTYRTCECKVSLKYFRLDKPKINKQVYVWASENN